MATPLARDHAVVGLDDSPERRASPGEAGATTAASPAKACADVDVALIGVRDAAQLDLALLADHGPAGSVPAGADAGLPVVWDLAGEDA